MGVGIVRRTEYLSAPGGSNGMRFMGAIAIAGIIAMAAASFLGAGTPRHAGSRWGAVRWRSELPSPAPEKPILLIARHEAEASGTSSATSVFSHPLIADAAGTLFVPVLQASTDRKHPITFRITSADSRDLCPPLHELTVAGVSKSMVTALTASAREAPPYLQLLADESAATGRTQRATFAMGCFWKGEGTIGGIRGVVSTKPGFLNGMEVVDAEFDPAVVSYSDLLDRSRAAGAADRAIPRSDGQRQLANEPRCDTAIAADDAPKFYLSRTPLRHVPITPAQASRVNAALGNHTDPSAWLSPRQVHLRDIIAAHPERPWPNAIGVDLTDAWRTATKMARVDF